MGFHEKCNLRAICQKMFENTSIVVELIFYVYLKAANKLLNANYKYLKTGCIR